MFTFRGLGKFWEHGTESERVWFVGALSYFSMCVNFLDTKLLTEFVNIGESTATELWITIGYAQFWNLISPKTFQSFRKDQIHCQG